MQFVQTKSYGQIRKWQKHQVQWSMDSWLKVSKLFLERHDRATLCLSIRYDEVGAYSRPSHASKNPADGANNPGKSPLTYVLESRTTTYIHVRTYVLESGTTNPCSYLCPGVQDYKSVFILMSWNPGLKTEYIIIPHSHTVELAAVIAERLRPGHEEQPNK